MHIGSIAVFEGQVPYAQFVDNIAAKLHLIPRYQQLAVPAPFNIGHPTWEWDPDFDITKHIHRVRAPEPGTDAQLFALAADLFAPILGRDKPLWEMYLVEGLENDRSALVTKVHHCLVDGVSGIELLMLVMDVSQTPIPPAPAPAVEKTAAPPPAQRFLDAIFDNMTTDLDRMSNQAARFVDALGDGLRARAIARAAETTLPYLQVPVVRAPFNKPLTPSRTVSFSEYSFQEIRHIRQAAGGTVNDVVLCVLGGALGRYFELHGQTTNGRSARVLTPVNVRRDSERGALGNRVSMLLVEVPVGVDDPIERLEIITKRTAGLKRRNIADGIESIGDMLNTAPPAMQAFLGRLPTPPNTLANMVCTNVPGPMIPLYSVGHRLQAHYPLVPLGWEMGVGLGVTSYDQKLYFGFMADANAAPDVQRLKEFADQAYVELRAAAGVERSDLPQFGAAPREEEPRRRRASGAPAQALAADAG